MEKTELFCPRQKQQNIHIQLHDKSLHIIIQYT